MFTIGSRAKILSELETPIVVPHTIDKSTKDFHLTYEQIFRNVQVRHTCGFVALWLFYWYYWYEMDEII